MKMAHVFVGGYESDVESGVEADIENDSEADSDQCSEPEEDQTLVPSEEEPRDIRGVRLRTAWMAAGYAMLDGKWQGWEWDLRALLYVFLIFCIVQYGVTPEKRHGGGEEEELVEDMEPEQELGQWWGL